MKDPKKDPLKEPVKFTLAEVKLPLTETDPVNCCVFDGRLPNMFEPLLYSTEDDITDTTNVCAVKVPATVKEFA